MLPLTGTTNNRAFAYIDSLCDAYSRPYNEYPIILTVYVYVLKFVSTFRVSTVRNIPIEIRLVKSKQLFRYFRTDA